MEFWGHLSQVRELLKVDPATEDKGIESATISLKIDGKKLVLETISSKTYPQLSFV